MKTVRIASGSLAVAVVLASTGLLWRMSRDISVQAITNAAMHTPATSIAMSLLATAISFACLAYYDRFAADSVAPGQIGRAHAYFTGAVSHAISNTLGFHALTATALRFRLYRQRGMAGLDVAKLTVLSGLCVTLGSLSALCLALLIAEEHSAWVPGAGAAGSLGLCVVVATYPAWSIRLRLHDAHMRTPARHALLLPLGVGLVEAVAAIGALYVLLPEDAGMPFAGFVALVSGAMMLGVISHAPGGIGVFETTVLVAFPSSHRSGVFAALLLYRALYNLLPFALASAALGVLQARAELIGRRIARHQPLLREVQSGQRADSDRAMAGATVGCGDPE